MTLEAPLAVLLAGAAGRVAGGRRRHCLDHEPGAEHGRPGDAVPARRRGTPDRAAGIHRVPPGSLSHRAAVLRRADRDQRPGRAAGQIDRAEPHRWETFVAVARLAPGHRTLLHCRAPPAEGGEPTGSAV
jgi:hypothetical protein